MIVGCYTLDLYCENYTNDGLDGIHDYREFPTTFTNEKGSVCRTQARKSGWKLTNGGRAYCPKCVQKMKEGVKK